MLSAQRTHRHVEVSAVRCGDETSGDGGHNTVRRRLGKPIFYENDASHSPCKRTDEMAAVTRSSLLHTIPDARALRWRIDHLGDDTRAQDARCGASGRVVLERAPLNKKVSFFSKITSAAHFLDNRPGSARCSPRQSARMLPVVQTQHALMAQRIMRCADAYCGCYGIITRRVSTHSPCLASALGVIATAPALSGGGGSFVCR